MNLAIITGGSKGLGKSLVEHYRANGWVVKAFSRSGEGEGHIRCDLADAVGSEQVINETFAQLSTQNWSRVVLINNAGILSPIGPIEMSEPSEWREHMQINLNAVIMTCGLFLKHFDSFGGQKQIANISSGAALDAKYGWSLYCSAKAALKMFTECMAIEQAHKPNPVSVFSLRPGIVDTQMQKHIREQDEDKFMDVERFKQFKSENKLRTPESVAKWVFERVMASPVGGEMLNIGDWD